MMRRLLGLMTSLGVAGVCLTSASAPAQSQKATEPAKAKAAAPDGDAPFKRQVIMRRPMNLERFLPNAGRDCRPYFQMEYHFIAKVCALTPEQAKAIAREGERALQEVILKRAEEILKVRLANNPVSEEDGLGIRTTLRGDLAIIARKHITTEQSNHLQAEYEKRAADWRRAGVEAILEMIDQELVLAAGQREMIGRSLDSHWQQEWLPSPDFLLSYSPPMPAVLDECVVKFLTENQRNVWKKIPKGRSTRPEAGVASSSFRGHDSLEDATLREAREAEFRARRTADRDKAKEPAR